MASLSHERILHDDGVAHAGVLFHNDTREDDAPRNLSLDDAATTIFAVGHPDLYSFLVLDQGWQPQRWAAWAETTLTAALLREA